MWVPPTDWVQSKGDVLMSWQTHEVHNWISLQKIYLFNNHKSLFVNDTRIMHLVNTELSEKRACWILFYIPILYFSARTHAIMLLRFYKNHSWEKPWSMTYFSDSKCFKFANMNDDFLLQRIPIIHSNRIINLGRDWYLHFNPMTKDD